MPAGEEEGPRLMRCFGRRPNPVFSDEYRALAEVVIQARQEAGLSQRELAARLGKAASHVSMIERGQRRIDSLELLLIAEACGVSPAALFQRISDQVREARRCPA